MTKDHAPFDEPWQAQLFALTVALSEAGHFSWPDWTRAFGATLQLHGAARPLDGRDDYWNAWLVTLEGMLEHSGAAARDEAEAIRVLWERAYLSTPHGQPVRLDR
ncbi:nitrile hydratase accessory protein [Defluviimonas sp. WL0002]|uniref:Nitrile hydratase accessory protein n=1 Tax=Albidovulum marisflavi TaxID=2984159 RepID=A0ABT2ZEW3_9RHOB|nr:nitrile hydratase accessory protein [Defluviimonas sp. WL0002]MCV2869651.1 nitrile hydratase accessory protein [Defluviimonas sp. WL0002]